MKLLALIFIFMSCSTTRTRREIAQFNPGYSCLSSLDSLKVKLSKETLKKSFENCLSEYIGIRTIAPQGYEDEAVEFLSSIFNHINIPYKSYRVPDLTKISGYRENFIATLPNDLSEAYDWESAKKRSSIILLNHMDVVDVNENDWVNPDLPWSGEVSQYNKISEHEYIWGRGALDMKSIAIAQLISMYYLKLKNKKMSKDIHFLALADEETASSGSIGTLEKMQAGQEMHSLSYASLILNEGGGSFQGMPKDKSSLFLISSEEKGGAWMKMKAANINELLKFLIDSRIINFHTFFSKDKFKYKDASCDLSRVSTPNQKVNVSSSYFSIEFNCAEKLNQIKKKKIIQAFTDNFTSISARFTADNRVEMRSLSSAHGSSSQKESALKALLVGLHRLNYIKIDKKVKVPSYFKLIKTKTTEKFIKILAKNNKLLKVFNFLDFIPGIKNLILSNTEKIFGINGIFRSTCNVTSLNFSTEEAHANVDCRLLHTHKVKNISHAKYFIKELKSFLNKDSSVSLDLVNQWNYTSSPIDSEDYFKIVKGLKSVKYLNSQKNIVAPILFPAGSDSSKFRDPSFYGFNYVPSIPSYGFPSVEMDAKLGKSFHGANERFPTRFIFNTIQRYITTLEVLLK